MKENQIPADYKIPAELKTMEGTKIPAGLMTPDAVVFDMDGVIFDSEAIVRVCWQEVGEKYGLKDVLAVCSLCTGLNRPASKKVFQEHYGPDFPFDERKDEVSALFHAAAEKEGNLPVKKGARELLMALKEHGIPVGLASSTRRSVVTKELADAGLLQYFDCVVCGDMVEKSKPDPMIFLKACELLKAVPEKTIGIEDSHNGIRALYAGGLISVMVPDMMPVTEEMKEKAQLICPSLTVLKELMLGE